MILASYLNVLGHFSRLYVDEMYIQSGDLSLELREGIQLGFPGTPIVHGPPVFDNLPQLFRTEPVIEVGAFEAGLET